MSDIITNCEGQARLQQYPKVQDCLLIWIQDELYDDITCHRCVKPWSGQLLRRLFLCVNARSTRLLINNHTLSSQQREARIQNVRRSSLSAIQLLFWFTQDDYIHIWDHHGAGRLRPSQLTPSLWRSAMHMLWPMPDDLTQHREARSISFNSVAGMTYYADAILTKTRRFYPA